MMRLVWGLLVVALLAVVSFGVIGCAAHSESGKMATGKMNDSGNMMSSDSGKMSGMESGKMSDMDDGKMTGKDAGKMTGKDSGKMSGKM
jgi:hypothetical protein